MGLFDLFVTVEKEYTQISHSELQKVVEEKAEGTVSIIDVRTSGEYENGNIQGALNMNVTATNFIHQLEGLDKNAIHYIICASGNRSRLACGIMKKKGFKHAVNVDGGMMAWQGSEE